MTQVFPRGCCEFRPHGHSYLPHVQVHLPQGRKAGDSAFVLGKSVSPSAFRLLLRLRFGLPAACSRISLADLAHVPHWVPTLSSLVIFFQAQPFAFANSLIMPSVTAWQLHIHISFSICCLEFVRTRRREALCGARRAFEDYCFFFQKAEHFPSIKWTRARSIIFRAAEK